jgi:hypothetical protein
MKKSGLLKFINTRLWIYVWVAPTRATQTSCPTSLLYDLYCPTAQRLGDACRLRVSLENLLTILTLRQVHAVSPRRSIQRHEGACFLSVFIPRYERALFLLVASKGGDARIQRDRHSEPAPNHARAAAATGAVVHADRAHYATRTTDAVARVAGAPSAPVETRKITRQRSIRKRFGVLQRLGVRRVSFEPGGLIPDHANRLGCGRVGVHRMIIAGRRVRVAVREHQPPATLTNCLLSDKATNDSSDSHSTPCSNERACMCTEYYSMFYPKP